MQSPTSSKDKIQEIKQALETWKLVHAKQTSLFEEREKIEKEWILLKEDIEQKTLEKHRVFNYNPKKAQDLENEISKNQEVLKNLRKKIDSIDLALEAGGEDSEERIEKLMHSLIETVLQSHPEAKQSYENFQNQLHLQFEKHKEVEKVKAGFDSIYQQFQEGFDTLKYSKKRKILDYFFGRHPKVIVSQKIHHAMKEGEIFLSTLKTSKNKADLESKELHSEMTELLEEFISDATRPWNQRLYTDKFLRYYHRFKKIHQKLNELLYSIEESIFALELKMEKMLENYIDLI